MPIKLFPIFAKRQRKISGTSGVANAKVDIELKGRDYCMDLKV